MRKKGEKEHKIGWDSNFLDKKDYVDSLNEKLKLLK